MWNASHHLVVSHHLTSPRTPILFLVHLLLQQDTPPHFHQSCIEELHKTFLFVPSDEPSRRLTCCHTAISKFHHWVCCSALFSGLQCIDCTENNLNDGVVLVRAKGNNFTYGSNHNPEGCRFKYDHG